ncbi:ribosomal protein L22 [Sulfobacillus acidophilus TPY]|uniref:Large ribosomal subunit protein uL22 n=1 Tax=Sulfobacillus acidophilus (strain ATCC 700253 / DSM 10332 / NAL) TaxID=679936 RepID=G8TXG2_SULAD|nr:ribosomal protein L22 [Sulfobacillus acidophilus TPY]AEW03861.1 ribosomal protein L22 [Sulfobacillus acidophilus DSM 10332]
MAMEEVAEARAHVRHVRIAPRKVRIVVNLIRGKDLRDAQAILRHTPKRASRIVAKLLQSAAANAQHNHDLDPRDLYVHAIWVDGGPILKRIHPRSRGQAFPIMKRTSHISVVLRPRHSR